MFGGQHHIYNRHQVSSSSESSSTTSMHDQDDAGFTNFLKRHCQPAEEKPHHHEEKPHHHSGRHLQDLLRNLGRKVRGSLDASGAGGESRSKSPRRTSCFLEVPTDPMFRSRSRSLDDGTRVRVPPSDCEATYRIYDEIVKEAF